MENKTASERQHEMKTQEHPPLSQYNSHSKNYLATQELHNNNTNSNIQSNTKQAQHGADNTHSLKSKLGTFCKYSLQ